MKIVKFVKIAQNIKKLTLVFFAILFLLPACKTPSSDTPLSAAREGENAAAETTAEKEVPVPESVPQTETLLPAGTEMPSETAGSVPPAGAESADKTGEPQMLERIVRDERFSFRSLRYLQDVSAYQKGLPYQLPLLKPHPSHVYRLQSKSS